MSRLYRAILAMLAALLFPPSAYASEHELSRVAVNGGEMEYAEYGNPDGEPVILVHGGYVADAFLPLALTEELSDYRLILVHLRGYAGSSDIEVPFGSVQDSRDIVELMNALDIPSAHWVGHSSGGEIAMVTAAENPERMRSITLIEPAGIPDSLLERFPRPGPPPGTIDQAAANPPTPEELLAIGEERLDRLFGGRKNLDAIPGAYEQYFADTGTVFQVRRRTPPWRFDAETILPQLQQPILYIYFEGGLPFHPALSDLYFQYHDNTEVVRLDGTHHSFHAEQPRPTAEVIADFLARNLGAGFEMPEEQFATINGVEIAYRVAGEGEPVLLIPNALADSFVTMMNEPVLDGYQLIQFHLPGQGHSGDLIEPRSSWTFAEFAAGLLDHLGIEQAHAVGHSGGATVAIRLAMLRPELVKSLVLLEPGTQPYEGFDPEAAFAEARDQSASAPEGGFNPNTGTDFIEGFMTWIMNDPRWEELLSPYIPDVREQIVRAIENVEQGQGEESDDIRPLLRSDYTGITQPTLWVWSDERYIIGVVGYNQLTEMLPHMETAYVPGTTHGLQLQDPRGVAEVVAGFVEQHPMD